MDTLVAIQVKMTLEARRLLARLAPEAVVLIELRYRPAACDSTFCKPILYVSTRTTGQPPEKGFVRTLSSGTPIFLQEPLAELAVGGKTPRKGPKCPWNSTMRAIRIRASGRLSSSNGCCPWQDSCAKRLL